MLVYISSLGIIAEERGLQSPRTRGQAGDHTERKDETQGPDSEVLAEESGPGSTPWSILHWDSGYPDVKRL